MKKLHFDVFVVGDDWVGKYDYLEELGVTVVYFPYGDGVSSTNLKNTIYERSSQLQTTADSHLPMDTNVQDTSKA